MTPGPNAWNPTWRWTWALAFGLLAMYVAARMGAGTLSAEVATPRADIRLPTTYASVDHPFHVARAETLWRELRTGSVLRWVGQHQGGYPVEFYPLGEAWLEVTVRALSLGTLTAEGAHTLAIIALFLLPGVAFTALAQEDGWTPAVGFTALALHVSLPGGWYDGGYTELVQWGLVTNVAGAVAAFSMLPASVRFFRTGAGWVGAVAAALAAFAVYSNPRSLLGLVAIGLGAGLVGNLRRGDVAPAVIFLRMAQVALLAALLSAPELIALARYGGLYAFVQYSGYGGLAEYASTAVRAVSWPVIIAGLVGLGIGLYHRRRLATAAAAVALVLYVLPTAALVVVPGVAGLAPQLEPTRLMPLQRLMTIYLAAVALWFVLAWVLARIAPSRRWIAPLSMTGIALAILLLQTRPLDGPPLDPASAAIPPVSLYTVAMSARPEQADLEEAVRAANVEAASGTALLVLGSALSWHQQLWAPLWTERPLFYDNWLWYWRPDHAGTPRYAFLEGHHYPDPERALDLDYLARHGIGAVVVTGSTRDAAAASPLLRPLRKGIYDVYGVIEPVTTVTFGDRNAVSTELSNHRVEAASDVSSTSVTARVNWHPRWEATVDADLASVVRLDDGYLGFGANGPVSRVEFTYVMQPLDWVARILVVAGAVGLCCLIAWRRQANWLDRRWYPRRSGGEGWFVRVSERLVMGADSLGRERSEG